MKILIPTIGSRGDVQPFIALAQGLYNVGHKVSLATHPVMKPLVESQDDLFAPIGPDIDLAKRVAAIRIRGRSTAMGLMQGMKFGFEMLQQCNEDIMAFCRSTDLVVVPTAARLRAGVPAQIIPHLADQFYWGSVFTSLG